MTRAALVALLIFSTTAPTCGAQGVDSTQTPANRLRKTVATINPFAVLGAYFAIDVERRVSPAVTIGGSGSIAGGDNFDNYASLEGKVRYYPNEKALEGFSIALGLGIASARRESYYIYETPSGQQTIVGQEVTQPRFTRATVGTDASYQWLIGPKRRFVAVLGVGVKRFLGAESSNNPFDSTVIPTARLNIGFAF